MTRALEAGHPIDAQAGGVVALAALISRRYVPVQNEKVAVLICGGNTIDFSVEIAVTAALP